MSKIEEARKAVISFLQEDLEVKHSSIIKIMKDVQQGKWEVEVEVFVPSNTMRALDLELEKEILDCKIYLFILDEDMSISAYGLKDVMKVAD
ncbi:MAG: hypothetical protein FD167_5990 [bacterium]|nr:MAG: hypothetical protein FD167_5990 [bacterium]